MRLTIPRDDLLKPLQQVTNIVERKQTLQILGNVLIVAGMDFLELTGSDSEVEVTARREREIDIPGEITIPARKLFDICKAVPSGVLLHLDLCGDQMCVSAGKSHFKLVTQPAKNYPRIKKEKGIEPISLNAAVLHSLIENTSFAIAFQDVRFALNGLFLELSNGWVRAVATDGHRLAMCSIETDIEMEDVQGYILPRKATIELGRLLANDKREMVLEASSNQLRIILPGFEFCSKLIDARFPIYQRSIPVDFEDRMIANKTTLRDALTRVAILSSEKVRGIRMKLRPGFLEFLANNPEQEQADEEIQIDYDGKEHEVGFNASYLLDAVNSIKQDNVRISVSEAKNIVMVDHPDHSENLNIVMPIRE